MDDIQDCDPIRDLQPLIFEFMQRAFIGQGAPKGSVTKSDTAWVREILKEQVQITVTDISLWPQGKQHVLRELLTSTLIQVSLGGHPGEPLTIKQASMSSGDTLAQPLLSRIAGAPITNPPK